MKQGTGKTTYGGKTEPNCKPVSVGAVSQIGNMVGEARAVKTLYEGKGVQAPKHTMTSHPSGSQGKH